MRMSVSVLPLAYLCSTVTLYAHLQPLHTLLLGQELPMFVPSWHACTVQALCFPDQSSLPCWAA
jgi:hypothetical protein